MNYEFIGNVEKEDVLRWVNKLEEKGDEEFDMDILMRMRRKSIGSWGWVNRVRIKF